MKKESSLYLFSDLHLYHRNIKEYEPLRKQYSENDLLNNIKQFNGKNNIFLNLGDLFLGNVKEAEEKNTKSKTRFFVKKNILIKGNHDKRSKGFYKKYFNIDIYEKRGFIVDDNIIFIHKPYYGKDLERFLEEKGYDINKIKDKELFIIHGHTHSKNIYDILKYNEDKFNKGEYNYSSQGFQYFLDSGGIKYGKKDNFDVLTFNNGLKIYYFNTSIENIGFKPIVLEDIFSGKKYKEKIITIKDFFNKL